jgi:DhnA family fructose-bisphosphate aldolase class Ia
MAYNAPKAGALDVDIGRNIFQSSNLVNMMKAFNSIVHKKQHQKMHMIFSNQINIK